MSYYTVYELLHCLCHLFRPFADKKLGEQGLALWETFLRGSALNTCHGEKALYINIVLYIVYCNAVVYYPWCILQRYTTQGPKFTQINIGKN
jgi:hypothetical protein